MGYAAFSLRTLYIPTILLFVVEKLRLAKLLIKHDCILCISTQRSRVPRWERELRRRLLLAPDGTKARCQMVGCRRSMATDRDVDVMVAEWRQHYGTSHIGEQRCCNTTIILLLN